MRSMVRVLWTVGLAFSVVMIPGPAAAQQPDYAIDVFPGAQTVNPGGTAVFLVAVSSVEGFDSPVTLSVSGLPEDATAAFEPVTVTASGNSMLRISTDADGSIGTFAIVVEGSGGGLTRMVDTSLTINFGLIPRIFGIFSGRVTDSDTGEPIVGARVFVDSDSYAYLYYYHYADGREYLSGQNIEATTDADGYYTLPGVPLGANNTPLEKMIGFYAEGYSVTYTDATAVGEAITPVDMALGHSTVTGRVTDASTGLPIGGATIYAQSYVYSAAGTGRVRSYLYATTDDDGVYVLPDMSLHLDNGDRTYTIQVAATGYGSSSASITMSLGATVNKDWSMLGGGFSGRVTDCDTGEPIAGARVFVDSDPYAYLYHYRYADGREYLSGQNIEATTDADGYYTLTGIPLGADDAPLEKLIGFYAEGYAVTYTNATAVAGAITPVDMALGHSTVTGRVTDASTGLPIAGTAIYAESYVYGAAGTGRVRSQLYATTDDDGVYVLPNMALHLDNGDRTYTIQASATGYGSSSASITMSLGATVIQDWPMLGGTFSGRVTDFDTGEPIAGARIFVDSDPYAYLYHYRYADGRQYLSGQNIEATSDADGYYTLTGVPLGTNNTPLEKLIGFYAEGYSVTYRNATAVGDAITPVDMALGHSTVTGRVTDASTGLPIGGATIYAYSYVYGAAGSGYARSYLYATTDVDGVYVLPDMALHLDNGDRTYTIEASATGYYPQTKAVTVFLGGTTVRDFSGVAFDTPPGTNVVVVPIDPQTGEPSPVTITFEEVTEGGDTTITFSTTGPAVPTAFKLGTPPTWFDITTTAVFEGEVTVCMNYSGVSYQNEAKLKLMHKAETGWEDITTNLDMENDIICGSTTSLSWLAIVEPVNTAPTADAGADQTVELESSSGTEVTLDGSGSTDPDSTDGTNDDIVVFDWWEGETFLGTGETIVQTFALGTHVVTLVVADSLSEADDDEVTIIVQDTSAPEVAILSPHAGEALQDGVRFTAEASDFGGIDGVRFYLREALNPNDPIGYEDLAATYNAASGQWEYAFNTAVLQDGYYIILAKAVDPSGNAGWAEAVAYSIRNWAVVELLPASENNKAGRTMPVKFSLRITVEVDSDMPFVYNEALEIRIYDAANPDEILQTSNYGDGSQSYRIDSAAELYITNFKTAKQPAVYVAEIWRPGRNFLVGSLTFETVK